MRVLILTSTAARALLNLALLQVTEYPIDIAGYFNYSLDFVCAQYIAIQKLSNLRRVEA